MKGAIIRVSDASVSILRRVSDTATMLDDATLLASVERALERAIDTRALAPRLAEAMRYASLGGGKRVRPVLAIRCGLAAGAPDIHALLPAAIAFEFIHAFSLVHDDLPALDNDDLRRGRPTTHKAFGEALAILAGDGLQSLALEAALASPRAPDRVALEVARACTDMISGQVYDTLAGFPADCVAPADRLALIHRNKTGALIRGACRVGALAAGASPALLERFSRYGEAMGHMFQVVDDILDETQTSQTLGKSAGKDKAQGKTTYPAVHGIERSRSFVRELREEALQALSGLDASADPLRTMARALATRTS
jgi:geranylgeranyl diphosphate synthase type II